TILGRIRALWSPRLAAAAADVIDITLRNVVQVTVTEGEADGAHVGPLARAYSPFIGGLRVGNQRGGEHGAGGGEACHGHDAVLVLSAITLAAMHSSQMQTPSRPRASVLTSLPTLPQKLQRTI